MSEMELRNEVLDRLRDQYGTSRVQVNPSLKGEKTVYPDIAVFLSDDRKTPFLLVKCSSFRTSHRKSRDLDEISEAVVSTKASYGALIAPNAEFVFSNGGPVYKSYAGFPNPVIESDKKRRPIQSQVELDFLVQRVLSAQESIHETPQRGVQAIDTLIESLHLLLEARRVDLQLDENIGEQLVSELQGSLSDRYQWYQADKKLDHNHLRAAAMVFNGFSLLQTDSHILEFFFELASEDKQVGEFSTP